MSQNTTDTITTESTSSDTSLALSDTQLSEVRSTLTELQTKFNEDSSLTTDIEEILSEYLHRTITPTTNQSIGLALEICFGYEIAKRLLELLRNNDPEHLKTVQSCTTPQMWQWLRRLFAIYGNDLQEAYKVWNENPDGWKDANRRASFDFVGQRWWLSLMIKKYDGTNTLLEDSPQSMLILASGIVDTLNSIPPDQIKNVITSDLLEDFGKNVDKLFESYNTKPDTEEKTDALELPSNEAE